MYILFRRSTGERLYFGFSAEYSGRAKIFISPYKTTVPAVVEDESLAKKLCNINDEGYYCEESGALFIAYVNGIVGDITY